MHESALSAYFARIGFHGARSPTLATLNALQALHPRAIPFENLDVLLQRPIELSSSAVFDKLVRRARGGYCFEHNRLLADVLGALGFSFTPLIARVQWGDVGAASPRPRSHMLLRVQIDDRAWFADVGFGGCVLTAPLEDVLDRPQATPHERFRVVALGAERQLQVELQGEFRPVYRFDLTPQLPIDYEVANHFTSTHPSSHFKQRLMVARVDEGTRHTLVDNAYASHSTHGTTERRVIREPGELRQLLAQTFGIDLPSGPELDALLGRVAAK